MARPMGDEHKRFEDKIEKIPIGGCWVWMATTYRGGYGHFGRWINGVWKMYKAHRYSYEYYNGPIPEGHLVRHTCDNPCCVNPAHLITGTTQDNVDDRMRRGRHNGGKKLTAEFVKAIRDNWHQDMKQYEYAAIWGISPPQMSRILRKNTWGGVL